MKLKEFIRKTLEYFDGCPEKVEIEFDIGVEKDMSVNENSPNRIKFKVITK